MAMNMAMVMAALTRRPTDAMSRSRSQRNHAKERRSLREWLLRGVTALAAGAVGVVGGLHSLAYGMRETFPERAHVLAPWDGRITALLSERASGPDATLAQRALADRLAISALAADPTAVSAVATLGINAEIQGNRAAGKRTFAYSQKLSRRDLRTRLWAIEDAVSRNNVREVLHNYDVAMRTSRYASPILYPVLEQAISDPNIRIELVKSLQSKPPWNEGLLAYLASTTDDADALAALFIQLQHNRITVPAYVRALAVQRLIALGKVLKAWDYYGQLVPESDRRQSRDSYFRGSIDHPTAFDWVVVDDNPGVAASIQANGNSGLFDFSVSTMAGGEVLRQLQVLPPGKYVLNGVSRNIDAPATARPYWSLVCAGGRELGRIEIPNSSVNGGRFTGQFNVPLECVSQQLKLVVRPSGDAMGVAGQIETVSLYLVE